MIAQLQATWRGLAPRERRLVRAAAWVVLLALAWTLAVEPAWRGRTRLAAELPRARIQLAQLEAMAAEAGQLAALPRTTISSVSLRAALEASSRAAGLSAQQSVSGDLFELRFKSVPFDAWLAWLDGALSETRLRVVDLEVTREPQPGRVAVRVVLERARGEVR